MNNIDEILENLAVDSKKEVPELNDFEKQRLLNVTMAKIEGKRGAKHVAFSRIALVCAVCFTLITSAVAADFFKLDEIFYKYLRGSSTDVYVAGEDITAQDTADGITVTAKQIIGDDYGFYVIFDVSGTDNAAVVNDAEVKIKGAKVYQCSDIISMQDENSNTFMLRIMSAENLQGKHIAVRLKSVGTSKVKDGLPTNSAKWNLDWKIDYSNLAKSFDVSKPVSVYGGTALWSSASISPVSVSVRLSDIKGTQTYCDNPNDLITVTMADGSVLRSDDGDDTDILRDTDFVTMSFNKIIDVSKVKRISFAGENYEIN